MRCGKDGEKASTICNGYIMPRAATGLKVSDNADGDDDYDCLPRHRKWRRSFHAEAPIKSVKAWLDDAASSGLPNNSPFLSQVFPTCRSLGHIRYAKVLVLPYRHYPDHGQSLDYYNQDSCCSVKLPWVVGARGAFMPNIKRWWRLETVTRNRCARIKSVYNLLPSPHTWMSTRGIVKVTDVSS